VLFYLHFIYKITKNIGSSHSNTRAAGQQFAFVSLSMRSPEDTKALIRDGMYIRGTKTYPRKMKLEPKQCMKCRRWGHFAAICLEATNTCGNCGGDHITKNCQNPHNIFCISCKTNDHTSWDRNCPEFLHQTKRLVQNLPENALKFFPTGENWTLTTSHNNFAFEWQGPAKYAITSLPPPTTKGTRAQTTRIVGKSSIRKANIMKEDGQFTLDKYVTKNSEPANEEEKVQPSDKTYNL